MDPEEASWLRVLIREGNGTPLEAVLQQGVPKGTKVFLFKVLCIRARALGRTLSQWLQVFSATPLMAVLPARATDGAASLKGLTLIAVILLRESLCSSSCRLGFLQIFTNFWCSLAVPVQLSLSGHTHRTNSRAADQDACPVSRTEHAVLGSLFLCRVCSSWPVSSARKPWTEAARHVNPASPA